MIGLAHVYYALGALLAWVAWQALRDPRPGLGWRRATNGAFWGVLAALFLLGDLLPEAVAGLAVLALAALAGFGGVGYRTPARPSPEDEARAASSAAALGHRLLLPVLVIPLGTLAGAVGLSRVAFGGRALLDPTHATLVSLGLACALALALALRLTRERVPIAIVEARRLLDAIGWAALLPILLATLGGVFTQAEVGTAVAELVKRTIPMDHRVVAVLAYGGGMTLLTMIMGNAFAAFPVMTAGVGLPLLVKLHGADPAALGAIGMLTGYCGTLMTPMAANFNIVPVALLNLPDQYAVIKAQLATAIPLFFANLLLMYFLAFR
ncbi:MAG: DUF979 family protein [Kofleriaceae bacterium]